MKESYIYLDHNATSPVHPQVRAKMMEILGHPTNPSSVHRLGQWAKGLITNARTTLSQFIEANPEEIIFTSGGTESNNMCCLSSIWDHVFISATEHDSVFKAYPHAVKIPVLKTGCINLEILEQEFSKVSISSKKLVSVQGANNETGVLQPLEEIIKISHKYGALVHSDGVQVFGKVPLSFKSQDLDFLTLSGHKMGGPQGVGVLIIKKNLSLPSFFKGGGQEKNRRAGTENVAAIVGLGEILKIHSFNTYKILETFHRKMEKSLLEFSRPHRQQGIIFGQETPRLPNTTCISMPSLPSTTQLMNFDLRNIAVSAGAACSSGTVKPSRVLMEMGYPRHHIESALRISSGWATTEKELHRFEEAWKALFLESSNQRATA